ncbi:TetR/AcrR family transcriptional regulator C-terminal domain-containing protein [Methylobacterium oryzae]|uniref:TetR/AcrR family transcriptional regulator C-terminal domain-containing protein n=1 Tax=Methylobacterium oryzae TaxID=334852 RepID=UPI003AF74CDB
MRRTLALTFFGDMDVSILDEKPAGRQPIRTITLPTERIDEVVAGLARAIAGGERVYWICPLVEESEFVDLAAAAEAQAAQGGSDDVETALEDLSRTLLAHGQSPGAAMLKRNLVAQALQFPELARLAHEEGWLRGVRAVAQLLDAFARRGRIAVADPEIAADLFLSLVLGRSSQATLYGIATDPEAQERRRQAAVRLFLDGVRPR